MILNVVDAHSSGAPCRTVTGGLDSLGIVGSTMLEKKKFVEDNHDWLRTSLLREPRGHPALNADLVVAPCDATADVGLIIINQRPVYPVMSGGNILCYVTSILEAGVLPIDQHSPVTTVRVDTPGGIVVAHAHCRGDKVEHVTVENVASYATHLDHKLDVPGLGTFTVDVAYGGMFYLIIAAEDLGLTIDPENATQLCELGERVREAAVESITVNNPASAAIGSVDAVNIVGAARSPANHGRSAVVMPMPPGHTGFAIRRGCLLLRELSDTGILIASAEEPVPILDGIVAGRVKATEPPDASRLDHTEAGGLNRVCRVRARRCRSSGECWCSLLVRPVPESSRAPAVQTVVECRILPVTHQRLQWSRGWRTPCRL
jgi:proline racemase